MNNQEKANAKLLRQLGFLIFEQNGFWAIHPKLICQYCVTTSASKAIQDLNNKIN
jgi:hypothetical protein